MNEQAQFIVKRLINAGSLEEFNTAFAGLIDLVGDHVYSRVRKAVAVSDCDDLVQEIFMKLMDILRPAQQDASVIKNFSHYLNRLISNKIIDYYRQRQRTQQRIAANPADQEGAALDWIDQLADQAPVAGEQLDKAELQKLIQQMVDNLPDQQKVAYLLWVHGDSAAEIATHMQISTEGVKTNLKAAKFNMRRQFCRLHLDELEGREREAVELLIKHAQYRRSVKDAGACGFAPEEFEDYWKRGLHAMLNGSPFAVLMQAESQRML